MATATATYDMENSAFPAAISGSGLSGSDITSSGNLAVFQQGNRTGNMVLQIANNSTSTADVARTNDRYATLTITGSGREITSISLGAFKGGSSVRGFALATSDDSFATFLLQDDNIDTVQPTLTTYTASGLSLSLSSPVEIRIYPYSQFNGQTSEFDNIVITTEEVSSGSTGTLAATEGADTASLAGVVLVDGALAATEGVDTASIAGDVLVEGALAATEGADTASIAGTLGSSITGALAATEGSDTASLAGDVIVSGAAAATESADTASFGGLILIQGGLAATEGADTAAFSYSAHSPVTITGSGSSSRSAGRGGFSRSAGRRAAPRSAGGQRRSRNA